MEERIRLRDSALEEHGGVDVEVPERFELEMEDAEESKTSSVMEMIKMFAFAFGNGTLISSYFIVTLPMEAKRISKEESAVYLGMFVGLAGITQLICPVVGLYSDRCVHALGKRRPFILYGGLWGVFGLALQLFSRTYGFWRTYVFAFTLSMIALNTIYSTMNGLIADHIPEAYVGTANGVIGMLGVGGAVSSFGFFHLLGEDLGQFYLFYIVIIAVTVLITFVSSGKYHHEMKNHKSHSSMKISDDVVDWKDIQNAFTISPTRHRDFFLVLVSRTLFYCGISSQTFFMFYLRDVIRLSEQESEHFTGVLAVIGQLCGVFTALPIGYISDRFALGRKMYIYVSCFLLALGNVCLVFASTKMEVAAWTCLIGAANGAYLVMDGSLAIDTLPSKEEAARFLGIWGVGAFIGTALGPMIGGPILMMNMDPANTGGYLFQGYAILLSISAIYFVLSALVLKFTIVK